MTILETAYAVRAHMVDGAIIDLLLFAQEYQAQDYAKSISPLPLGFDFVDVVPRRVIGSTIERRVSPLRPCPGLACGPAYRR